VLQTIRHRLNIYASSCVALALCRWDRWGPQTRYTLRRNTASIVEGLDLIRKRMKHWGYIQISLETT